MLSCCNRGTSLPTLTIETNNGVLEALHIHLVDIEASELLGDVIPEEDSMDYYIDSVDMSDDFKWRLKEAYLTGKHWADMLTID